MTLLSHRGYWKSTDEKNAPSAFKRSFSAGFGTETDLRDASGKLVVSHDPPTSGELLFEGLLEIYREYGFGLPLALNVKADGLQAQAKELLDRFGVENYFFFDMSVPDALGYLNRGLHSFTRKSEYETTPSFYDRAGGVWVDMFLSDWVEESDIAPYLSDGKKVCLVSPDLHRRDPLLFWERVRSWDCVDNSDLMICTDRPEEARKIIHE